MSEREREGGTTPSTRSIMDFGVENSRTFPLDVMWNSHQGPRRIGTCTASVKSPYG